MQQVTFELKPPVVLFSFCKPAGKRTVGRLVTGKTQAGSAHAEVMQR